MANTQIRNPETGAFQSLTYDYFVSLPNTKQHAKIEAGCYSAAAKTFAIENNIEAGKEIKVRNIVMDEYGYYLTIDTDKGINVENNYY